MAQLKEIIEKEKDRNTMEQCLVSHIFKEGTFYRAYEWSAWLCHRYVKEFKPTHRLLKDSDDSIVFVGFPRYVDDFYVVSADRGWLLSIVPKVRRMLSQRLGLDFHDGKLEIVSVWHGVEFVGAYVKPFRRYASRSCVARMRQKLKELANSTREKWVNSLNSFCGVLSHGSNYNLRISIFISENPAFCEFGYFEDGVRRYVMAG